MKSLNKLMRGNKGATAVEYGIIAALIAVVAVAGFTAVGTGVQNSMSNVASELN